MKLGPGIGRQPDDVTGIWRNLWCEQNNVELITHNYNSIQFLKEHKELIVDKGADGVHYGEETHKNFAGLFNA